MIQVAECLLLICSMFQDGSNFNISHRLLLGLIFNNIVISAFLQCKIMQFLLSFYINFFLIWQFFYIGENKKSQK